MAGQINLNILDPVDLTQTQFGPDAKRWLSDVVDIINATFNTVIQALAYLVIVGQANAGGSGKTATVTVVGIDPSYYVTAAVISSTNPNISVTNTVAGSGNFVVTFNADPGASAMIAYQVYAVQPQ